MLDTIKEFKINEYITLKLEDEETVIYVNNIRFLICKYLLITIPAEQVDYFEDIKSIDEASDLLDKSLEPTIGFDRQLHRKNNIPPDTEFWGHCSNLQVWVEHNYDTRFLHSNLAFPLLRRLTEAGDSIAKQILQEEIYRRFESFYPTTIKYLLAGRFLRFLTEDQRRSLLETWMEKDIENVVVFLIGNNFLRQFGEQYRPIIMENLDKYIKKEERVYLAKELAELFEEINISTQEEFIIELFLKERSLLIEIFELRQYPVPEKAEGGINYSHLSVLKELYGFLEELGKSDIAIKSIIANQVRELFESPSIGNMFSLLRYDFYKLLSLDNLKQMMVPENSAFLDNLFNYLGHNVIMQYFDAQLVPCDFLYFYLDEEAQDILAERIGQLPSDKKASIIDGLTKMKRHKTYAEYILKFTDKIFKKH